METYEWISNGINIYLMDFDICMYITSISNAPIDYAILT